MNSTVSSASITDSKKETVVNKKRSSKSLTPFPQQELRKTLDYLRKRYPKQKTDAAESALFWAIKDAIANYNTVRKTQGKAEI
jgi:hypothetical protein